MPRVVLGNDPFQRGAAKPADLQVEQEASAPAVAPKQQEPRKRKQKNRPEAKRAGAAAKPGARSTRKKQAQAPSSRPADTSKTPAQPSVSAPPRAESAASRARPEVEPEPLREPERVRARETFSEPETYREPPPVDRPAPDFRARATNAIVLGRDLLTSAAAGGVLTGVLGTAAGLWRALQTGIGSAGAVELDDYGRDAALARELHPLGELVYDRYFRVRVEGAEKVPAGAAILVANHSGALPLDGPVLHAALARERGDLLDARWLVEDQVFLAPFLGTLLNRLGAVRACPENALRLLGEGRPVIVFPEGIQGIGKPYKERYRLMRFGRGGFVKLALRTRAPIVPVAIVGAEESMPLLARLPGKALGLPYLPLTSPVPLPARWTIRFGDPLPVDDHPPAAQDDVALVHRLNERTRETVQGMLDALLKARSGVFA